jgi:DNA-binding beta-propeller fold protein YncE
MHLLQTSNFKLQTICYFSLLTLIFLNGCKKAQQPQAVWLSAGDAPGQTVYPRGIAYDEKTDTFFVVDRQARIQQLDKDGKYLNGWRMPEWAQGKPVGISIGPDGHVWVPDTHYHRVMVYTTGGQLLKRFGTRGSGPGEFDLPTDVAWDAAGNIYVSEYGQNNRVQMFDAQMNYIRQIGRTGQGDGELSRPQSIVVIGATLYVADACNNRIAVFGTDGQFHRNIGRTGAAAGEFRFPYGLEKVNDHTLLVTEFGNMRVQCIDTRTNTGVFAWGAAGRLPGELMNPWATAIDSRRRAVIADAANNRLQVVALP